MAYLLYLMSILLYYLISVHLRRASEQVFDDSVMNPARKVLLPRVTLTQIADGANPKACLISSSKMPYFVLPLLAPSYELRRDGDPGWVKQQFNLLPIVIDEFAAPWAEATLYLLSRAESTSTPNMASLSSIADDLAAYRRFVDEYRLDWTDFPPDKLSRPTYRFNGHLKFAVNAGTLAASTAHRRMNSVVAFYRWLINAGAFHPANEPWKDKDRVIRFCDGFGFRGHKTVPSTDVSVRVPQQHDPFDGLIDDGGKLRPMSELEQEWLINALGEIGNTEMTLIHLVSLLTGARIQTVLTMKVQHALLPPEALSTNELRLPVGAGTGIDTKNDNRMVLHIPVWLYERLQTYVTSERSQLRRKKSAGGDLSEQHLFLTNRGAPLYESKASLRVFDEAKRHHHRKSGQAVRQFISERVIPLIQERYKSPFFHYRFHDLRATAGMNWTDAQLLLVQKGEISLSHAREFVKTRMGHRSTQVTDRYLKFRHSVAMVRQIEESHENHLRDLVASAMRR